jgi:hypothetical protein
MKVTGYQIREALRRWHDRRDIHSRTFTEALWQFSTDQNGNPVEIAQMYEKADRAIAALEVAQQEYNQRVTVKLSDGEFKLSVAVKRVGGAGRLTKMWRSAATSTGRDRYSYRENRRSKDDEFAKRMVAQPVAMEQADKAAQYASQLRAAIAVANGTEIELESVDPNLLG